MKHTIGFTSASGEDFDTVISGLQWFSTGETLQLTYSFSGPGSEYIIDSSVGYDLAGGSYDEPFRSNFSQLSNHQQQLTRQIFNTLEKVANIQFTEIEDSSDVDIRMAITDISDDNTAAYAFLPLPQTNYTSEISNSPEAAMELSGDIWLSHDWLQEDVTDNVFISVLTHEIGHALGLDHPFQNGVTPTFSSNNILTDTNLNYSRYTTMSYEQWPTDIPTLDISYWTAALTAMPLDIQALESMYGASIDTGDDVYLLLGAYEWDNIGIKENYAQQKNATYHEYPSGYITIIDSGGYNELWLEFLEDQTIDLNPGTWSDTYGGYVLGNTGASDPNLYIHESTRIHEIHTHNGNDTITANDFGNIIQTYSGNDSVTTGNGDDLIYLGSGNDVSIGHTGNDTVDGGDGIDSIDFQTTTIASYHFTFLNDNEIRATHLITSDTITFESVENLQFDQQTFSVENLQELLLEIGENLLLDTNSKPYESEIFSQITDISATEAQLYRSYLGGMGRAPDQGGFDWWMLQLNSDTFDLNETAARFIDSPEFRTFADSNQNNGISHTELLDHMYENVLGREADKLGYNWWLTQLEEGTFNQAETFNNMTQSDEFVLLTANTVSEWLFS